MTKGIKTFLIGLLVVILLLLLGLLSAYILVEIKLEKVYQLPDEEMKIEKDQASIARGEHLVNTLMGCTDCHGRKLEGRSLFDDRLFGRIAASNLTAGKGGVGGIYRESDWERAIRHGVDPEGKPLIYVMASVYHNVGDEDLHDMIAYLANLPPVDNPLPPTTVGLMSRYLILIDPTLLPAQIINHDHSEVSAPEPGVSSEYGEYLATACTICHRENFAGGLTVGAGLNLTPSGDLKDWTEADFTHALRTGYTPDGTQLDSQQMPWLRIKKLTDDEIKAIWLYLQSLPPVHITQD